VPTASPADVMGLIDARTREVFGSMLNLEELEQQQQSKPPVVIAPTPISSRDSEVFEVEAAIELAAADVELPKMYFPLQTRLSARDLEVFEPEDVAAHDEAPAPAPKRFISARDSEYFEDYSDLIKEAPAIRVPPATRPKLSARDTEVCEEGHDWMGRQVEQAPALVRARSGRDMEFD